MNHGKGGPSALDNDLQQSLLAAAPSATAVAAAGGDVPEEQQPHRYVVSASRASSSTGGERQPNRYRDAWAAILFLASHAVLLYLALAWGVPALHYSTDVDGDNDGNDGNDNNNNNDNDNDDSISFTGLLWLLVTSSGAALLLSGIALSVLIKAAHRLVQASLLLTVASNVAVVLYLLAAGYWTGAIGALLLLAMAAWYAVAVWRRVPFAAANLATAVQAVHSNGGLVLTAHCLTLTVALMTMVWALAWLGVYVRSADCGNSSSDQGGNGECVSHMHPLVLTALLLMFYWTAAVGKNVLHVTTAGVVGTWWFAPDEACTFCSPAVNDSLVRACTFSAGSVCLGSLLTAILQVLHHLAHAARRHGRGHEFLLCVLDCILGCLERLTTYFNKFAYVYIGLYGYDYLTAGKKVMSLFVERGWTAIINDNLVSRVLALVCIVIGLLTGCVGLLLARASPGWVSEFGNSATAVAFLIPALVGTAFAYILMGVVASAVDTVIVAFCEAPLEFEQNHPGLSVQMVEAWRQIYPESFGR